MQSVVGIGTSHRLCSVGLGITAGRVKREARPEWKAGNIIFENQDEFVKL